MPRLDPGIHFYEGRHWIHYPAGQRHPAVFRTCAECGIEFICSERQLKVKNGGTFCSIRCSVIRRARDQRGRRKNGFSPIGSVRSQGNGYLVERIAPDDEMIEMEYRNGWVLQHRLVVARSLGRPLRKHETVHHVNGNRQDNNLENLQLRSGNHGKGQIARCADCGSSHIVFSEV